MSALFPTSLPLAGTSTNTTLAVAGHLALHNNLQDDVRAIATKLGTGSSTASASQVLRGTGAGTSAWGQVNLATDVTGLLPTGNIDIQAVVNTLYPVGVIYTSIASTNPGTLFSGTTWIAFAKGQVLVGQNPVDTDFDVAEETGGAKTHTLTSAEMPVHTHVQDTHTHTQNSHSHSYDAPRGTSGGVYGWVDSSNSGSSGTSSTLGTTATNQNTIATNQNTGSGGAHNNLQPYVVVYMWKRTA